ncbi:transcription factor BIM2 isoform X5 [Punica granatum]|uniref:Transcription factor BIM2 isoform X5 n=1 Tax=Punica granatum TaxID=22663 RepID=A0A6P8D2V4_PUNGR|nr:transcription factor BIM2 isoform X5 [Punica granatum]
MKSGKGNQEYEEYEEDDFNPKRDGPSSNTSNTNATGNTKDKNSDKANAIRSKHSVTEQRRRSKINERFQILRDLIPHSEQKRDTASFLLEVIDYVKYLQEKVQKYEGSYPGWNSEPAKLMPWNTLELEAGREVINKSVDQPMPTPVRTDGTADHPLQRPAGSDLQSVAGPFTENLLNQSEDLSIEGGTINISSVYSQGLLNTLTDALQNAGLDLSQARISVQIDLGKRANRGQMDQDGPISGNSVLADIRDAADGEEGSGQAQKRQKT